MFIKPIFFFNARTGFSKKYKTSKTAANALAIENVSQITHAKRRQALVSKVYAFSDTAFTREQKEYYSNLALKNEINSIGEVWRPYKDGIEFSSLGRIKVNGVLTFPQRVCRRAVIELSRRPTKRITLGRAIAEVFITKRPLKDNEIVYHKGSLDDFRPHMLYVGPVGLTQKNMARNNCKAVAQLDESGNIIEIYDSQRECARHHFVDRSTISRAIRNNTTIDGKIFKSYDSIDIDKIIDYN